MRRVVPLILGILAILGLIDGLFLTLIHFNLVGYQSQLPNVCSFRAGTCETALSSSYSTFLGVPNGIWGMLYYLFVLANVGIRLATGKWLVPWLMLGVVSTAAVFSIFLIWVLLGVIRIPCPFCLTAHFINFTILAVYAIYFRTDRGVPLIRPRRDREILAH